MSRSNDFLNFVMLDVDHEIGVVRDKEDEPIKKTVVCPLVVFNYKATKRATFSEQQCRIRIEEQSDCVAGCKIAERLKSERRE